MTGKTVKYPGLPPLPPPFAGVDPPIAEVITKQCIGCDRCPPLCFFDSLFMEEAPGHPFGRVAVVVPAKCTGCGLCFEACPVDAFRWVPGPRPARPDGGNTG